MKYLLIDPFNQDTSGVTTYNLLARDRLAALGWQVAILARSSREPLADFCWRVAQAVDNDSRSYDVVEAPESLAVTRHLRDTSRLHVRLHGSRHFGAWLQGQDADTSEQAVEQAEVLRARWVSAPSSAAAQTHRLHFGATPTVHVYPNPAPGMQASTGTGVGVDTAEWDYLFLGRWQPLKGTHFFAHLARALPARRFGVACSKRPADLPIGLHHLAVTTPAQRAEALARSAVVVVPSLFETASMVALEALAARRPVVTWAHLGAVEYAASDCIHAARPWDMDDLLQKARKARDTAALCDFVSSVERINLAFDQGVRALLAGQGESRMPAPQALTVVDYRQIFSTMPIPQTSNRHSVFQRRLRKLMRDPAAYWRDSALRRALGSITGSSNQAAPAPAESSDAPVVQEKVTAGASAKPQLIGTVLREGFVKLKPAAKAVAGWRVCIVHASDDADRAADLVANLGTFLDFSPFRAECLNLLRFEHDPDEALPDLIGRFDQKNKELLAQVDHLLLLDVPANLAKALRSCAPASRTVAIVTRAASVDSSGDATDRQSCGPDCSPDQAAALDGQHSTTWCEQASVQRCYGPPEPNQADALLCLAGSPWAQGAGWRRKLVIPSVEQLPVALLRLMRETGPKGRDMLLQIRGEPRFDPALHEFDPARYQGLIRLGDARLPSASTLRELVQRLSPQVADLYVLESVYLRYRSLCAEVEDGATPDRLIEACLHDGVLFDVA